MCGAITTSSPDGTQMRLSGANTISFATSTAGLVSSTWPTTRIRFAVITPSLGSSSLLRCIEHAFVGGTFGDVFANEIDL